MTEILIPTRAKAAHIATKRYTKTPWRDGTPRVAPARDAVTPIGGMLTGRETERLMAETARDYGADEAQVVVETYKRGDEPIEVNPRHRGRAGSSGVYSGFSAPTPEEMAAYPDEFKTWGSARSEKED